MEILKLNTQNINLKSFSKIASFDYDHTLVRPLENRKFPKDENDYMWLLPTIPDVLQNLYSEGYLVVIFTNQSKEWKKKHITNSLSVLQIPILVMIAFDEKLYKPNKHLFNSLGEFLDILTTESFFVGDALGREGDFSDSDLQFAKNVGLKIYSPEEFFKIENKKISIEIFEKEVVIMVGYPGSGKSTICSEYFSNYGICSGDELKTVPKLIKKAVQFINTGKSVVIDATNSSKEKRKKYVDLALLHNYSVRCIWVNTDQITSYDRNRKRTNVVPKIAYSVYNKHFEEPSEIEGFRLIKIY